MNEFGECEILKIDCHKFFKIATGIELKKCQLDIEKNFDNYYFKGKKNCLGYTERNYYE
jgi:hypothetical protein